MLLNFFVEHLLVELYAPWLSIGWLFYEDYPRERLPLGENLLI